MSTKDLTELIENYSDILSCFFDHITDMFFLMSVEDNRYFRYITVNPAGRKMGGITEEAYGKRIEEVYPAEKAEYLNQQYRQAVLSGKPVTFVSKENRVSAESILTPIYKDGVCTHVFCVTRDVTERKLQEEKLQYLAYHDALTGLPNRRLFQDRFRQAMIHAKRYQHSMAILFLDCDNFKTINDTMGHDVGDELLQGVTKRLKNCIRDTDTIARVGGDEFILLLAVIHQEEEVYRIADRILTVLSQPWTINEQEVTTSVSIGISIYPRDGEEKEDLLRKADMALYEAKTVGKNNYKVSDDDK